MTQIIISLDDLDSMAADLDTVETLTRELLKKTPLEEAKGKGTYFTEVPRLIDWIEKAPYDCKDVAVIPPFKTLEGYLGLTESTSSYEIGLSYLSEDTPHHRYAGIAGFRMSQTERKIPFLTVYGHLNNVLTKEQRTYRVFFDTDVIENILRDIGIVEGPGYLVVAKGNKTSVGTTHWRANLNSANLAFSLHTHPIGADNYHPSDEANNAGNDPKGGDFAALEERLKQPAFCKAPMAPLYLSAAESRPSANFEF